MLGPVGRVACKERSVRNASGVLPLGFKQRELCCTLPLFHLGRRTKSVVCFSYLVARHELWRHDHLGIQIEAQSPLHLALRSLGAVELRRVAPEAGAVGVDIEAQSHRRKRVSLILVWNEPWRG